MQCTIHYTNTGTNQIDTLIYSYATTDISNNQDDALVLECTWFSVNATSCTNKDIAAVNEYVLLCSWALYTSSTAKKFSHRPRFSDQLARSSRPNCHNKPSKVPGPRSSRHNVKTSIHPRIALIERLEELSPGQEISTFAF